MSDGSSDEARGVEDLRFACEHCGVKWFVPAGREVLEALLTCAACGGQLIVLQAAGGSAPGWLGRGH